MTLELEAIGQRWGDTQALDGVSLSVTPGEILGVTGPSGAGKSTLCRIVAGVQAPSRGEVCLDGQRVTRVPPERRRVAIMFESYALYPHLSVFDNVAFPLRAPGASTLSREGLAGRVRVLAGDLFAPLAPHLPARGADLVVANPPYIETAALPSLPVEVRDWEPRAALDGGADGLAVVRRVLQEAPAWLGPGGWLLAEIGETHGPAVAGLVAADPRYAEVTLSRDFRGRIRFVEARRR